MTFSHNPSLGEKYLMDCKSVPLVSALYQLAVDMIKIQAREKEMKRKWLRNKCRNFVRNVSRPRCLA
jgi:hypothetical protein